MTCLFLLAALVGQGQSTAVSAGPVVSVEVSRVYCLVRFVQTVTGDQSTYRGSRRAFEQSRFNTPATLRYLRQQLPALHGQRLHPEQSFVLSTTGPAGPIMVVCMHEPAQLTAAAAHLRQRGHIDVKQPFIY